METSQILSIDQIIDRALSLRDRLPPECAPQCQHIAELRMRLADGRLHLAVLGQFNRGKSTFINALLGAEILPVSVLPLTSIPTVIAWGATESCTISFYNGTGDVRVDGSADRIRERLAAYVTEERNPKNRLCVDKALVTVPSELLRGGTVIIDTPGFASTYVHNTKTTVDLLSQCDAAFLLLSADLPITQNEVEFLKQVHIYVPRLFFVFNKIDLVSAHEQEQALAFIRGVIVEGFGRSADPQFFPVSARKGLCERDSEAWRQSGMAAVEERIKRFLAVDKYFTLSRALNRKFDEALERMLGVLRAALTDTSEPLQRLSARCLALKEQAEAVSRDIETERAAVFAERAALYDFVTSIIDHESVRAHEQIASFANALALKTPVFGDPLAAFRGACPGFLAQTLARVSTDVRSALATPLRRAAAMHRRTYAKSLSSVRKLVSEASIAPPADADHLEDPVVEVAAVCDSVSLEAALARVSLPVGARISSRHGRAERVRAAILPPLRDALDTSLARLRENAAELVDRACDSFRQGLERKYADLCAAMNQALEAEDAKLLQRQEQSAPRIRELEEIFAALAEIRGLIRG